MFGKGSLHRSYGKLGRGPATIASTRMNNHSCLPSWFCLPVPSGDWRSPEPTSSAAQLVISLGDTADFLLLETSYLVFQTGVILTVVEVIAHLLRF